MAAPSAYELARMFTRFMDRDVRFTPIAHPSPSSKPAVYGVYGAPLQSSSTIVKADLALMGSFGGVLVGLPDRIMQERLAEKPVDDYLLDALHEILNVTATPLSSETRAVLETMHLDETELPEAAKDLLHSAAPMTSFHVHVPGYSGGMFHIKTLQKEKKEQTA